MTFPTDPRSPRVIDDAARPLSEEQVAEIFAGLDGEQCVPVKVLRMRLLALGRPPAEHDEFATLAHDAEQRLTEPVGRDLVLAMLVTVARHAVLQRMGENESVPRPGDLVVEVSTMRPDPDAIGWLVHHGEAPYAEDGSGETREVWDVFPVRGLRTLVEQERGFQRWENAEFWRVPSLNEGDVTWKGAAPPPAFTALMLGGPETLRAGGDRA